MTYAVLRRIRRYLSQDQAKRLNNAFINSQFNYAPIIWMFCRKNQYLKIQKIHHKALKVVFNSDAGYDEFKRAMKSPFTRNIFMH